MMTHRPRHVLRSHRAARRPLGVRVAIAAAVLAVLGLTTPAYAQAAESHTSRAAVAVTVTVAPGNTMWGLAASWCGDPNLWTQIRSANPAVANPNLIYVGQRLLVPCATRGADRASRTTTRTGTATGWVSPLPGVACTSGWGAPRAGHTHQGIDLPARAGTPIRAAHAGTVALIRYQAGGAGHYLAINHGGGTFTVYMHLIRRTPLAVGAHVAAGQTVGYVGATGNAQGPHLHFEVHRGLWNPVNPATFLRSVGVRVGC